MSFFIPSEKVIGCWRDGEGGLVLLAVVESDVGGGGGGGVVVGGWSKITIAKE